MYVRRCAPEELHRLIVGRIGEASRQLGRAPTASELAAIVGVDRQEVVDALTGMGTDRTVYPAAVNEVAGERSFGFDLGAAATEYGPHDGDGASARLAALPEPQRTVLFMRFFASLTQTQIADRLGMSAEQVYQTLVQALGIVRTL